MKLNSKNMRISIELAEQIDKMVQNYGRMISKIAASKIIARKIGGKNRKQIEKVEWGEYT